jgi:hypothetical protein
MRSACIILVGIPRGKKPVGNLRIDAEILLKWSLNE